MVSEIWEMECTNTSKQKENKSFFSYSKPCDGCMRAIAEFDIKNVMYTDESGEFVNL